MEDKIIVNENNEVKTLFNNIKDLIIESRNNVYKKVNVRWLTYTEILERLYLKNSKKRYFI